MSIDDTERQDIIMWMHDVADAGAMKMTDDKGSPDQLMKLMRKVLSPLF